VVNETGYAQNPTPFNASVSICATANYGLACGLHQEVYSLGYKSIIVVCPTLNLPKYVDKKYCFYPDSKFKIPMEIFLNIQKDYGEFMVTPGIFGNTLYRAIHAVHPPLCYVCSMNFYARVNLWMPEWISDLMVKKIVCGGGNHQQNNVNQPGLTV